MATLTVIRPRSADPAIELTMDTREAADLARVILDRKSSLPVPQWMQDLVKLTAM